MGSEWRGVMAELDAVDNTPDDGEVEIDDSEVYGDLVVGAPIPNRLLSGLLFLILCILPVHSLQLLVDPGLPHLHLSLSHRGLLQLDPETLQALLSSLLPPLVLCSRQLSSSSPDVALLLPFWLPSEPLWSSPPTLGWNLGA
ncbi:hypothetical protein B0H10DRAFT_2222503 [Mycena sp. CBHHK59/15]|nr:hypothetical protein B0H10DRAFT_2222503 [Mycena sp. CBHHK59/15]